MSSNVIIDSRHDDAEKILSSALGWSAAAGFVPLPVLDVAALATVQVKMVNKLNTLYNQQASGELARGIISVLLGTLAPVKATEFVLLSGAKSIPVIGTVAGSLSMAAFGTAATYAIGKVFIRHFERGGTIASLDVEAVKEELKAEFAQAAKKA